MSIEGQPIAIDAPATSPAVVPKTGALAARFERLLVALGDRLNPILVKETRQALKSRQFVVTFALLLICGWVWSLLGVAIIGPGIYYGSHGPSMFIGYFLILAFPLLVVVPYGAFRSLAAEQEERTYEMLSITALGPRQIVWGKFGSSAMQMLVYLSAITPCLAFTYMLRGISFPTILVVVFYLSLASLSFSMLCLFLGTLTTEKYLQVIVSVLAIVGLLIGFFVICQILLGMLMFGEHMFRDEDFWIGSTAVVTFIVGYFVLVFEAAAARITFASDNRSTRLRVVMLAQFAFWTAWMAYAWVHSHGDDGPLFCFVFFAVLHWYVMGAMMTGESPELSLRVRRQLPRSTLGRVFLTWFNPGPATGYVFAIAGLFATLLLAVLAVQILPFWAGARMHRQGYPDRALYYAFFALCYATFFLGLGTLLLRVWRKRLPSGIMTAVISQMLLLVTFSGIPAIIHLMSDYRGSDYSILQVVSPIWTLGYILSEGMPAAEEPLLFTLVPAASLAVLLLNAPGIVHELRYVRLAAPERVAEEDAELAAQKAPPQPTRTSPWDD